MNRTQIVQRLTDAGAAAVIRLDDASPLLHAAGALLEGGLSVLEVTMTTPDALRMIERLSEAFAPDALIGVGSVLDDETARRAIDAGARFVVSPVLKPSLIDTVHQHDCAALPGAFTPTEIQHAHELGADIVKVFPASVLGSGYFRAVLAPLPHLKLMPTGGVTLTNAGDWLQAGACAVGIGSALLDTQAIAEENYAVLRDNARTLRATITNARPGGS